MKFRNDIENAPKEKPILVIDPDWMDELDSIHTVKVVKWFENDEVRGWTYGYDYEFDKYLTVVDPKYWCELPQMPEKY